MTPTMRWVAPPNWPSMPVGFEPAAGWQPDPSWPPPPPGWQFWQPVQIPAAVKPAVKGSSAFLAAGGLVAAIGSLLSWLTASTAFGFSDSRSGISYGDGVVTLILGILAVAAAGGVVFGWSIPRWLGAGSVIDGLVIVGITIYDAEHFHHRIQSIGNDHGLVNAHLGTGLWVTMVGGFLVLAGALAELGGLDGAKRWLFAGFGNYPPIDRPPTAESS